MWFNFIKNDSPQRHGGTEKTVPPSFPHTTLQVLQHLANRSTLVVRRRESILTLKDYLKWIPAKASMTKVMVFSVPLCLCGEAFEYKASQP
jgi:hypothetical protein